MINVLEYDEVNLSKDEKEIKELAKNIKTEATQLNELLKDASLINLLGFQDRIEEKIQNDYDKLLNICDELLHIASSIHESRKNYNICEEKISDMLDRIKL